MPASRRSRRTHRPSLIARIAKELQGEPEPPRRRLWQDTLTAALLLPLGLWTAILGLVYRSYLADEFLWFETTALIVVAGGMAALQAGVCRAVSVVFPRFSLDEDEVPSLLLGMPFLALAFACGIMLSGSPFGKGLPRLLEIHLGVCLAGVMSGLVLSLGVPAGAAIWRGVRKRRSAS